MWNESNLVGPLVYGICCIAYLCALHKYVKSSTRRYLRKSVQYYPGANLTTVVETVCLTKANLKVTWPDCKTPYFAWRVDKHTDGNYRLVYGYQVGFNTVIVLEHWFGEADLYDDGLVNLTTYCRKQMEKVLK